MPSEVLVVVSVEFSGSGNLSSGGGGAFRAQTNKITLLLYKKRSSIAATKLPFKLTMT